MAVWQNPENGQCRQYITWVWTDMTQYCVMYSAQRHMYGTHIWKKTAVCVEACFTWDILKTSRNNLDNLISTRTQQAHSAFHMVEWSGHIDGYMPAIDLEGYGKCVHACWCTHACMPVWQNRSWEQIRHCCGKFFQCLHNSDCALYCTLTCTHTETKEDPDSHFLSRWLLWFNIIYRWGTIKINYANNIECAS